MGLAVSGRDVITVQSSLLSDNGPGPMPEGLRDGECKYPVTFARKQAFDAIVESKYRIRLLLEDNSGMFRVGSEQIVGAAYLAERKE